jgi:hypothetical protein
MTNDKGVALQRWVRRSREEEKRFPSNYISAYDLQFDEEHVWMTQKTYDAIFRNCGRYDNTEPPGAFLGKVFLRRGNLVWFSIKKGDLENFIETKSRIVLIKDGHGPARRVTWALCLPSIFCFGISNLTAA